MFPTAMSNSTSLSEEASVSSDPDAEVIALSPKTLLATNRFVCEICNKGFQRDQNLQLHRRGHNLPWKLKQRNSKEIKKRAYVCPEPTCVHHHPSRALGDLTGIKKHFCRKHGEKKWKCEKCSKIYAVQSDWKAHSKTCGTREYRCDCGTLFSRKDSFITHRAFCDALAEESARLSANQLAAAATANPALHHLTSQANPNPSSLFPFQIQSHISLNPWDPTQTSNPNPNNNPLHVKPESHHFSPFFQEPPPPPPPKTIINSPFQTLHVSSSNPSSNGATSAAAAHLSATALLQKAATVGATATQINNNNSSMAASHHVSPEFMGFAAGNLATWQKTSDRFTRDFLGLTGDHHHHGGGNGNVNVSMNVRDVLTYAGGIELQHFERDHSLLKPHGFGFAEPPASETWGDC
ncbi:hypothetical protein COLO4_09188 [Corchorus olitorius]|uniref:C2H2-type domain-containing protein n=1 Tax=Corchorus olitorius TaxID=93759 RepID=A0A1R3KD10_9ROSI|nr:hypothetical protein COLO4_09188 [Corchorus olitorius]